MLVSKVFMKRLNDVNVMEEVCLILVVSQIKDKKLRQSVNQRTYTEAGIRWNLDLK